MAFLAPPIQLASANPKKWDEEWEKTLATASSHPSFSPSAVRRGAPPSLEALQVYQWSTGFDGKHAGAKDDGILQQKELRRGLGLVQADIVVNALSEWDRFEAGWTTATPAARGDCVLAALSATCSSALNLNGARFMCAKELKVESHRNDAALLLKLVKEITDSASHEEPVYISHPVWDAIAANQRTSRTVSENEKLALAILLVTRNKLIAHVLEYVVRSVLGLPKPEIVVNKHYTNKKSDLRNSQPTELTPQLTAELGKAGAKQYLRAEREALKGLYSQWKQNCQTCKKPNETEARYSRCKRCWDTMQREVLYCSPACQKIDWKGGHKAICGQALKFKPDSESKPPAPDTPSLIGLAVTGYQRSPALLTQIKHINASPGYDYFIWANSVPIYFIFPHPPVRAAWRAAREKAFTTGDHDTVAAMFQFLIVSAQQSAAPSLGATDDVILRQMMAEYKFWDLERTVDETKAKTFNDSMQRPPLLSAAGFSMRQCQEYSEDIRVNGFVNVGIFTPS
ncbi:hypothetical protein FB45DRAFT_1125919 [Roridomyces roridus]|uniref:MYND-type domain-containing protein n=1 Tax=Roridomyces roridus TaxID=1738132 RepID=A0AAD7FX08_9AGAR|nr:hypothetical protein FB45DRAFT_1125919 [Roridomyces roridus]